jgi:hypothetical protein
MMKSTDQQEPRFSLTEPVFDFWRPTALRLALSPLFLCTLAAMGITIPTDVGQKVSVSLGWQKLDNLFQNLTA